MPRLTNTVPKYRKHRASGQAVVEITGRTHYLGPHGSKASRLEYDRLIMEWLAAGRPTFIRTDSPELTIVELIVQYLKFCRSYYRKDGEPTSYVGCLKPVLSILKDMYGRTPAVEFGPLALKALRTKMIAIDWSRTHVNQNIGRIKRMSNGLLARNYCRWPSMTI